MDKVYNIVEIIEKKLKTKRSKIFMSSKENNLIVDLDGTLLKTDLLYESFWSALSKRNMQFFEFLDAMKNGIPSLKSYLAEKSDIDVSTLPYNQTVIEKIEKHKKNGGAVILATGADKKFAKAISNFLPFFDNIHYSEPKQNLVGNAKATLLVQKYGERKFVYMGDGNKDIPVWSVSNKVIAVNPNFWLKTRINQMSVPVEFISRNDSSFIGWFRAFRPQHWLKNVLIFVPMIASQQFASDIFVASLLGFLSFCFITSAIYLLNDLLDLQADRCHPRKKNRPFASGSVSLQHAHLVILTFLCVGLLFSLKLGLGYLLVSCLYIFLTAIYTLLLKKLLLVDLVVLSSFYCLRVFAGGEASGLPPSNWLIIFSAFIFLSLASIKRLAEIVELDDKVAIEKARRAYTSRHANMVCLNALISGSISLIVLWFYAMSDVAKSLYSLPEAILFFLMVLLFWLCRLIYKAYNGAIRKDPLVFATTDTISVTCGIISLCCLFIAATF